MKQPPRPLSERLLGGREWRQVLWLGGLEAAVVLALFFWELQRHGEEAARSLAFTTLVFSQLWRSFGARSDHLTFWRLGAGSNLWLLGVVLLTGMLQVSLHFFPMTKEIFGLHPLGFQELAVVLSLSLVPVTTLELKKLVKSRY